MDIKLEIRKWALQNAVKYGGKANAGAVVGKLIAMDPSVKARMKDVSKDIQVILKEVNAMKPAAQLAELQNLAPELLEEKKVEEKPRELPELPDAVEGKVVTRMPPEPSKYNHIGHALAFLVSYLFAKKYKGTCVLRFEDTNPEKSTQEFLDAMRGDIAWLGITADKEWIMSDHMDAFFKAGEQLVNGGHAYACFCAQDIMRDLRFKGVACAHRETPKAENLEVWKGMHDKKYREGEVSIRLKGDMASKNGVMRDPVLFKVDYHKHFRTGEKYCVWPLYDMASTVAEQENGVTHVMRSAEFVLRAELHDYLRKLLSYRALTVFEFGRFNVIGATTQGREIRELIDSGKMLGWDDPRLVTLKALRRRGIVPETIHELVMEVGLKRDQANIDWTMIASINRKILDPKVNRHFYVENPVEIEVEGAPQRVVKLDLHPDHPERGTRTLVANQRFFIAKRDFDELRAKKFYRLMECLNFTKGAKGFKFESHDVEAYRAKGERIMHWLPAEHKSDLVDVEVLMPDATVSKGIGEPCLRDLNVNDVVQLERFGFCRVDRKEGNKVWFWYTHK
ncbi:glutamate--tRNA ligase [Candidatus Woesearchaeota archaeon]|nr:glutamate--tRNA ligase [Candidatus Woesearchaeota archaeon]